MFYDNLKAICKEKNTNVSTLLKEIGRSTGLTGSWKSGRLPNLEILMLMANHLDVSLDYLVYGKNQISTTDLRDDEIEILKIYNNIPTDKRSVCLAFLKTHIIE